MASGLRSIQNYVKTFNSNVRWKCSGLNDQLKENSDLSRFYVLKPFPRMAKKTTASEGKW